MSRRVKDRRMVPATGLEPVRCYSLEPESSASANSATRAQPPLKSPQQSPLPIASLIPPTQAPICARSICRLHALDGSFLHPRHERTQALADTLDRVFL